MDHPTPEAGVGKKPHVVCIPLPAQGHIKPMLDLAKLLFHRGFHITFVNTHSTHKSLLESRGPDSVDGLPGFTFQAIPDDFPSSEAENEMPLIRYKRLLAPFRDLLAKLNHTATSEVPPPTCIVADGFMFFTLQVAQELRIPIALLFTFSASSFMLMKQLAPLRDKGFTPLKDKSYLTNGYLDTVLDWIPGMKDIRARDLPSFIRTTDPNDAVFEFGVEAAEKASTASALVINSFKPLEQDVLDAHASMSPQLYAVGPLDLLLNKLPGEDPLKSIGYNIWKEDMECLQWLDSRPHNSVIYVNFGSLAVLTQDQIMEFGWGLANSKHPFLWIIRPGLVIGDAAIQILPPEFLAETKERSMVTSWCPQEQVLNHQAIGGFLTHSGWNSTIESICAGVPMLCWPFTGDQMTNCRYTCREWEIGMEIDKNVKRDEVEKLVRELMEGEKGKKMRSQAMEWKKMAEEATSVHGSSSIALDNLVDEVLLSKEHILPEKYCN